jgi:PST family polysaccharide transporter
MLSPVTQALYPRMSHLFSKDPKMAKSLLRRSGMLVCGVAGSTSFALWLLSDWLIWLLAGDGYAPAAQVLRWLALLPLVVGMSNLMGVQYMLPKQMNKAFNAILALASIFSLSIVYISINANSANGAAQTLLAVECFVTLSMLLYILKKKFSQK